MLGALWTQESRHSECIDRELESTPSCAVLVINGYTRSVVVSPASWTRLMVTNALSASVTLKALPRQTVRIERNWLLKRE
jgi:hypothetical protein